MQSYDYKIIIWTYKSVFKSLFRGDQIMFRLFVTTKLLLILTLCASTMANAATSYSDFIAKKQSVLQGVNRMPSAEQAKALTNIFLIVGNKPASEVRREIDANQAKRAIVREQADALKAYLDENLLDFAPKPANFNLKPIPRGQPGNEDMAKSYIWIAQQNKIFLNDPKNRTSLNFNVPTKKYTYNQIPPLKGGNETTVLQIRDQDSVDAAEELAQQGLRTALLNFANKVHHCGGYLTGQSAQEEDICRRTTLFAVLNNNKSAYPIGNDQLIYSSDIKIFRKNWSSGFALQNPVAINVITMAAYNLNQNMSNNDANISDADYKNGMREKIRAQLRIAAFDKNQAVVVGAFGAGVFAQNAKKSMQEISQIVASLYREVLGEPEFQGVFKIIRFAILGSTSLNFTTFKKELSQVKYGKLRNEI